MPVELDDGRTWIVFYTVPWGDFTPAPYVPITAKGVIRRRHEDTIKPLPKTPRQGFIPWRRVKGRGDFVRWFEFDDYSINGRHVFPAQFGERAESGLFVSEAFANAAIAAGLKGLDYHATGKPDGPEWYTDPRDKDFPLWY